MKDLEISYFLAQFLGVVFTVFGSALLKNPSYYLEMERDFYNHQAISFLGYIVSISLGVFIIIVHNEWVWEWPLLITLLGWVIFLKNAIFLLFPERGKQIANWIIDRSSFRIAGPLAFLIGLFLLWHGFY